MWICLIGAEGTCKQSIAEFLHKQEGFRVVGDEAEAVDWTSDHFLNQIDTLLKRYRLQFEDCQQSQNDEDIVQVRSFWDTHEVYSKVLRDEGQISQTDYKLIERLYETLMLSATPPQAVFYCYTNSIDAYNRMKLNREEPHHEEYLLAVRQAYAEYVRRIRIPVVEIPIDGDKFDNILDSVRFGLNSLKSTNLAGQSIWKRSMLRT